jgi:hypothetical protein
MAKSNPGSGARKSGLSSKTARTTGPIGGSTGKEVRQVITGAPKGAKGIGGPTLRGGGLFVTSPHST